MGYTMRLFHVSEEENIPLFLPRRPSREDLDPGVGLVWAIDEDRLPNYLTPRDCPRVTFHMGPASTEADMERFFPAGVTHVVAIERGWAPIMEKTTLYLYEFDPAGFALQDAVAGYYVAKTAQRPLARHVVKDLFGALASRGVEVRVLDELWTPADDVMASSLNYSFCRMANALPRT